MSDSAPEPGFVQAYRLYVVIRILFWLAVGPVLALIALTESSASAAANAARIELFSLPSVIPLLAVEGLLLALLVWPAAPRRMGKAFVPLTLGLGLLPLLVGYYWWPAENPLQSPFAMFFFVTAVLIAWEYKHRWVLLYVALLTVFEALVSPWPVRMPWSVPVGWLVLQAVMMLLAGYVTATLALVQRNQRSALAEAYQRQAEANRRLQEHAAVLEELVTTRERNRLARELHDTLAHSLSARSPSNWRRWHRCGTPSRTKRAGCWSKPARPHGAGWAKRAGRSLRLRASPLDALGLSGAIAELAENSARRAGAELSCDLPDAVVGVPLAGGRAGGLPDRPGDARKYRQPRRARSTSGCVWWNAGPTWSSPSRTTGRGCWPRPGPPMDTGYGACRSAPF